jgi:hypothetical protein
MINQGLCLWFSPLSAGAISGQYSGLRSRHLHSLLVMQTAHRWRKKLKEECVNIQSKPEGRRRSASLLWRELSRQPNTRLCQLTR